MTIEATIRREIEEARAVAAGLRDAAKLCGVGQGPLQTRLIRGAQAIEMLIRLLERERVRFSLRVPQ